MRYQGIKIDTNLSWQCLVKGYFCCLLLPLLKMCHLRHRLRIFLFHRKVMFRVQDIQVFVFLIIPWHTKSDFMKRISTWDRVHFWIYFLNHSALSHQTWAIDRYNQGIQGIRFDCLRQMFFHLYTRIVLEKFAWIIISVYVIWKK